MITLLGIALSVVWIIALIDVARRRFDSTGTKVVWFLLVLFLHVLGAAIYFLVGRKQGVSS